MFRAAPLIVLLLCGACQMRKPASEPEPRSVTPAPPAADSATAADATVDIELRLISSRKPHATPAALDADRTVEQLSAPRLLVHPYQRGSMTVMNEQAPIVEPFGNFALKSPKPPPPPLPPPAGTVL